MKRWLAATVLAVLALGTIRAEDNIYYQGPTDKDRKKLVGPLVEETAAWVKVKVKVKGKDTLKQIPAAHIKQVDYDVDGVGSTAFRAPILLEAQAIAADEAFRKLENTIPKDAKDKKNNDFLKTKALKTRDTKMEEALKGYQEMEGKVASRDNAKRYVQYRIANLLVLQSRYEEAKTKPAIEALTKFKDAHPNAWQILPALKTLGKMQVKEGLLEEARKTYEALAEVPDVPADLKQEADFLVARIYLRGERYADAEKKLASVEKSMAKDDPQRAFITAFRAESQIGQKNLKQAEALLNEAIRTSNDNKLRGLAHNLLGDYYRQKGVPAEAFWHYLRVDALYDQDPEEHAKALYYLIGLFDKVKNDPIRAQDCAQRLRDGKYLGTRYQAMAAAEKKGASPGGS